jgi:hypothetical protein
MSTQRLVTVLTLVGAAAFLAAGAWAFADPASFYVGVARYASYNQHFLHDIGAFELGLGAALVFGLAGLGGRATALWGAGIGSAFHALSHFLDRGLGGRAADPFLLAALAALLLTAAALATARPARVARPAR